MKEVLKLALEALEADELDMVDDGSGNMVFRKEQAITAIKEALTQSEQCQCPNCKVTLHASDCAVHNEPAYPKGACNCGAQPEQEPMHPELRKMWEDYFDKCFCRQPLRSYEIAQILDRERMKWNKSPPTHEFDLAFARAIEAAHGIKE